MIVTFCGHSQITQKERVLKNEGLPYVLSPYALIWDGDFYYVLGMNHGRNQINTFRTVL